MTWEPKNGLNDEDVDVSDEEEDVVNFKDDKNQHHTGIVRLHVSKGTREEAQRERERERERGSGQKDYVKIW